MTHPTAPAPGTYDRARGLWFALLAPPSAWAAQELLGWFFGERTCGQMTPPAVRWIVLAISVAALLVALTGIAQGWSHWRAHTDDPGIVHAEAHDRVEFMALGGLLVSSIFTIAIVWGGLSSAFLFGCGRMR